MFFGPVHYAGPAQGYNSLYNADLVGSVVPSAVPARPRSRDWRRSGPRIVGAQIQENGSYIGIPLIAIAIGIVVRLWRKLWPVYLAMLIVTTWLLSLGPLPHRRRARRSTCPFDLPFRKIDRLPGIENILPIRFSLYVVFFVAILVAMAIDGAWRTHVSRTARHR